jgi:hypothetical protein
VLIVVAEEARKKQEAAREMGPDVHRLAVPTKESRSQADVVLRAVAFEQVLIGGTVFWHVPKSDQRNPLRLGRLTRDFDGEHLREIELAGCAR